VFAITVGASNRGIAFPPVDGTLIVPVTVEVELTAATGIACFPDIAAVTFEVPLTVADRMARNAWIFDSVTVDVAFTDADIAACFVTVAVTADVALTAPGLTSFVADTVAVTADVALTAAIVSDFVVPPFVTAAVTADVALTTMPTGAVTVTADVPLIVAPRIPFVGPNWTVTADVELTAAVATALSATTAPDIADVALTADPMIWSVCDCGDAFSGPTQSGQTGFGLRTPAPDGVPSFMLLQRDPVNLLSDDGDGCGTPT